MDSKKHISVLLIENNENIIANIKQLLISPNIDIYTVHSVSSLTDAIHFLKKNTDIDIILLDLSVQTVPELESSRTFYAFSANIPLVFITESNEDLALQAINIGAQDYLFKGTFDTKMLVRTINYAVERKKIERDLEQRKDDFISATSHELKTPLTSQKAFIQVLDNMTTQHNDQKYKRYINKIALQNEKLSQLVNNLLDASKIKDGRLLYSPSEFDFKTLVEEIITDINQTNSHTIILNAKTHIPFYSDKAKIDQVITNLIHNAIKYSQANQEIIVTIDDNEKSITVSVQDFGIGIDKGQFNHIFEPFYRIHGHKERTFPGLGIGLFISAEIIKHLGGTIWLESTKGKGSTFFFSLPKI